MRLLSFVQLLLFFGSLSCFGESHLPAANSEKESKDIGLLLLLKFLNVFKGTHLRPTISTDVVEQDQRRFGRTLTVEPHEKLRLSK